MALLVHLDRVDAVVGAGVAELGARLLERLGDLADAVAEDVGEADEERRLDAAFAELIDEVLEVDGPLGVLVGVDGDVPELVDPEVALAPVLDAVGLERVVELPRGVEVGGVGYQPPVEGLSHQRSLPLCAGACAGHQTNAIIIR